MEQNTTTTTTIETTTVVVNQRPTFLTVLCILSFIFGGLGILGLIMLIVGMGAISAGTAAIEGAGGTITSTGPSMGLTWAYLAVGFVTALISLYGVVKMWKMEKIGFFLYTGATVVSMIMGVVYSGFGFMTVLPLVFVILYGLNLKHLK